MSAVAAKPQAGGAMNPTAMVVGVVLLLIILALCWYISPGIGLMALIGVIIGGVLIGFGTHFVPVGGAHGSNGSGTWYCNRCRDARCWCRSRRTLWRCMGSRTRPGRCNNHRWSRWRSDDGNHLHDGELHLCVRYGYSFSIR